MARVTGIGGVFFKSSLNQDTFADLLQLLKAGPAAEHV